MAVDPSSAVEKIARAKALLADALEEYAPHPIQAHRSTCASWLEQAVVLLDWVEADIAYEKESWTHEER